MTYVDRETEEARIWEQYQTKDKLAIRIETHEKYTEPKLDFHSWILDHIPWNGTEIVLDVGCGTGAYASPAIQRAGRYIGADLSLGMVQALPQTVAERINLNAQHLPLGSGFADVVLANHMLYHVIDLLQGLREIRRILKPGGFLIAATNSGNYMPELRQLQRSLAERYDLDPALMDTTSPMLIHRFNLENGGASLGSVFAHVERYDLEGALVFAEPGPLLDYLGTMRGRYLAEQSLDLPWEAVSGVLEAEISRHIKRDGEFRVSKLAGVFVCSG